MSGSKILTAASARIFYGVAMDLLAAPDVHASPMKARDGMAMVANSSDQHDWPQGVPRDYEELWRDWGKHIANLTNRFNKIERNLADLHQYIWERLLNSHLLEKYVSRCKREPAELSALEACVYLGITWREFHSRMEAYHGSQKTEVWAARGMDLDPRTPPPGTIVRREYQGRTIEVKVLSDGMLEYNGQTFKSFSGVAKAATGAVWNGWKFFNLKEAQDAAWVMKPDSTLMPTPIHGDLYAQDAVFRFCDICALSGLTPVLFIEKTRTVGVEVVSAEEAADILGLSWEIFQARMVSFLSREKRDAAPPRLTSRGKGIDPRMPPPGTVVRREYNGQNIEVLVIDDGGLQFEGCRYTSFSTIATKIAGHEVNGWVFFRLNNSVQWMPTPVNGDPLSAEARYRRADLIKSTDKVSEEGSQGGQIGTLPTSTKSLDANFAGYLKQAVYNHYCNFVRTKDRREKDRPFDMFPQFTARTSHMVDPPSYEEMIPDGRENRPEIEAELSIQIKRVRDTAGPHKDQLFEYLQEGYLLAEAIEKLDVAPHERRQLVRAFNEIGMMVSTGLGQQPIQHDEGLYSERVEALVIPYHMVCDSDLGRDRQLRAYTC